jgi:hypothetical protein
VAGGDRLSAGRADSGARCTRPSNAATRGYATRGDLGAAFADWSGATLGLAPHAADVHLVVDVVDRHRGAAEGCHRTGRFAS